ncbi:ribonuclease H-like domain-containing protein [Candidatus Poribacteria bacterium]|nr:ribonuclease H-like domain-containing protein [Candidatus Poribacteria bacterium]
MKNPHEQNTVDSEPNVIYFDLETQKTAQEVGGWSYINRMRLAVAVTYSTTVQEYATFFEPDVDKLINQLTMADVIVGFNLKAFDYVVLSLYTSVALWRLPTFDILERIRRTLGFRVSLDALAKATLGESKSADGLQSVRWWKEGKVDLVSAYCRKDVEVTKRLYEYACRNGYLRFTDRLGRMGRIDTTSWGH